MITKASQRGGGRQLATHLLNRMDNERADVLDIRGAVADDLHGAFQEWYVQSQGTRAEKFLYSMSINPWQDKYSLTHEQYLDFISRTERALKLKDQPRVIVRHVIDGREHYHVVWSRIMPEKGRAVQISFDRKKMRMVAREFARDHGLELPRGMQEELNREKDRFNERAKRLDLGEAQQEKRTGLTKEDRMAAILLAWKESRDGREFADRLEKEGYVLASGDSRDYVVLDRAGEVHSLTRQLKGAAKAKDVHERLAGMPPESLRGVEETRALIQERDRQRAEQETLRDIRRKADEAREKQEAVRREHLDKRQHGRRAALTAEREALALRQQQERDGLLSLHKSHTDFVLAARADRQPGRIMAFLQKITGIQAFRQERQGREDKAREDLHRGQLRALEARHDREVRDVRRRERDMAAVETRERHALEQALKREHFLRAITRPREITPEFIRAAEPESERGEDGSSRIFDPGDLSAAFRRRAARKDREEREGDRSPRPRAPDRER